MASTIRPFPVPFERPQFKRSATAISPVSPHFFHISRSLSSSSRDIPARQFSLSTPSLASMGFAAKIIDRKRFPKKKKSLASYLTLNTDLPVDPSPFAPGHSPRITSIDICPSPVDDTPSPSDSDDQLTDRFHKKSHFITKNGVKLHPYQDDAPYMQAYEPILLENDRQTEALLQKLNPTGTPSFRAPYRPPAKVLDLGCGPGSWVLEAAATWKAAGTKVIGLDLVDVFSDNWKSEPSSMENVEFVRGNFLKYDLPFPDNTFDFVRMANLTLCIPYDKWQFVLGQVRRVLAPSGRLELIDDQIFFPYGKAPVPPPWAPFPRQSDPPSSTSSFHTDEDSSDEGIDVECRDSTPQLPHSFPDPYTEWESRMTGSKSLETVFERMLEKRYGIHPRPFEFIRAHLQRIFGRCYVNKVTSKHLLLAPSENAQSDAEKDSDRASMKSADSGFASGSSSSGHGKKPWITIEWDKKEKKGDRSRDEPSSADGLGTPSEASVVPDVTGIKAASLLGVDRRPTRAQSPGLIIWPETFIPFPPSELEMHVCKHMHVLLGCKSALAEYVQNQKDAYGKRLVGDQEFEDLVWEYECFRRQRFNWPSDAPEMRMEEESSPKNPSAINRIFNAATSDRNKQSLASSILSNYNLDDLTHVRTIRIFEALKVDQKVKL